MRASTAGSRTIRCPSEKTKRKRELPREPPFFVPKNKRAARRRLFVSLYGSALAAGPFQKNRKGGSPVSPNSLRAIIRPAGVLASHTPPEFDGVKLPTSNLTELDCSTSYLTSSNSSSHLAGTNAAGAGVDVLGRTVHHSLYSSYIGLPGPVGSSMRMGNLNAKSNTLTADIALCHLSAPPSGYR